MAYAVRVQDALHPFLGHHKRVCAAKLSVAYEAMQSALVLHLEWSDARLMYRLVRRSGVNI